MTLRLHKKHPTTVPTNPAKEARRRTACRRSRQILPIGWQITTGIVFASILIQALLPTSSSAGDSLFRKPATKKTTATDANRKRTAEPIRKPTWSASKRLDNSSDHLSWSKPTRSITEQIHKKAPSFVNAPKNLKRIDAASSAADTGALRKASHYEFSSVPLDDVRIPRARRNRAKPPQRKITTINQPTNSPNRRNSRVARQFQRNPEYVAMQPQANDDDAAFSDDELNDSDLLDSVFGDETDLDTPITEDDGADLSDPSMEEAPLEDEALDNFLMEDDAAEAVPADDTTEFSPDDIEDESPDLTTTDEADEAFSTEAEESDLFDEFDNMEQDADDSTEAVEPPADDAPSEEAESTDPSTDDLFSQPNDADSEPVERVPEERAPADEETVRPPRTNTFDDTYEDDMPDLIDLNQFDGRNCPEDLAVYKRAWKMLETRSLADISLDITPEYEPNIDDKSEANQMREERLANSPNRDWYNREGKLVASGRLENYQDGNVVIRNDDGVQTVKYQELSNADMCVVGAWWQMPTEYVPNVEPFEVRNWTSITFTWKASGLCHKPLYFEEVQLERYGHSAGPAKQTFLSGAHFFGSIFFLPYKIGLNPPNECQYALGYYRPGNCAPWLLHAVPLNSRAARMQLGAITGGIGIIP